MQTAEQAVELGEAGGDAGELADAVIGRLGRHGGLGAGEQAPFLMIDGAGYLVIRDKEAGKPVDVIYPAEGTPVATSPSVVFKAAPNPNAARLFFNWMHGREGQPETGLAACLLPEQAARRLWPGLAWIVPLCAMLFFAWLLRDYFLR